VGLAQGFADGGKVGSKVAWVGLQATQNMEFI